MERENITNVPTLKIYKLTEAQYKARLEAGNIDENAFYFTKTAEKDSHSPQGAGNMIVTLDENDVLNHSFMEIQTHIQSGGTVTLFYDGRYWSFDNLVPNNNISFIYHESDTEYSYVIDIYTNNDIEYYNKYPLSIAVFFCNSMPYQFVVGETWRDWVQSDNNYSGFYFDSYANGNAINITDHLMDHNGDPVVTAAGKCHQTSASCPQLFGIYNTL